MRNAISRLRKFSDCAEHIREISAHTNDKIVLFLHFGVFMKLHAIKYLSMSKSNTKSKQNLSR